MATSAISARPLVAQSFSQPLQTARPVAAQQPAVLARDQFVAASPSTSVPGPDKRNYDLQTTRGAAQYSYDLAMFQSKQAGVPDSVNAQRPNPANYDLNDMSGAAQFNADSAKFQARLNGQSTANAPDPRNYDLQSMSGAAQYQFDLANFQAKQAGLPETVNGRTRPDPRNYDLNDMAAAARFNAESQRFQEEQNARRGLAQQVASMRYAMIGR